MNKYELYIYNQHFPHSLGTAHQLWLDVAKSLQYAKCCAQFAYFASTQQRSSNKSFQDFCLLHKSSTSQVQRKIYFRPCGHQLSMQLLPRPQRPKIGFVCYALPRHIPNGRLKEPKMILNATNKNKPTTTLAKFNEWIHRYVSKRCQPNFLQ